MTTTRFFAADPLPTATDMDWLVIMGGPMNIYEHDRYPWLPDEKTFIGRAIESGCKVVGVCLGAQLIADVLGASVYRNRDVEIGWFPVDFLPTAGCPALRATLPPTLDVFHWHGDTFELPSGAERLASNPVCTNQAFIYKANVLALQFHMELTHDDAATVIDQCRHEIVDGPYIQQADDMLADRQRFDRTNAVMAALLDTFAGTG